MRALLLLFTALLLGHPLTLGSLVPSFSVQRSFPLPFSIVFLFLYLALDCSSRPAAGTPWPCRFSPIGGFRFCSYGTVFSLWLGFVCLPGFPLHAITFLINFANTRAPKRLCFLTAWSLWRIFLVSSAPIALVSFVSGRFFRCFSGGSLHLRNGRRPRAFSFSLPAA